MKRTIHYYLIKMVRLSGWTLLVLMAIYIVTGFALCDKLGMRQLLDTQSALVIHQIFDWPLLVAFAVHASLTVYFALRRWGWIKNKN
jgi:succinate dehydrogenase/fumarate reductase cytochrome b subunit